MNDAGFNNMFTCYEKDLKRLNDLSYQEVHKKYRIPLLVDEAKMSLL